MNTLIGNTRAANFPIITLPSGIFLYSFFVNWRLKYGSWKSALVISPIIVPPRKQSPTPIVPWPPGLNTMTKELSELRS